MELEPVMEINYKKTYEKYKSVATVTYQSFMLRMREHNMTWQEALTSNQYGTAGTKRDSDKVSYIKTIIEEGNYHLLSDRLKKYYKDNPELFEGGA